MKLNKGKICNSPFLGVYSFVTDDYCIVPNNILKKEETHLKKYLKTKIIKTTINQSPLIGVYITGNKHKVVANENSITTKEIEILEKEGIKIKTVNDYNALGNLVALNSQYGIASVLLNEKTISTMKTFFNMPIKQEVLANGEVPGSSLYVNDNLFVVNPNVSEKEYNNIQKNFKVNGKAQTLNYGDMFVANDVVGNKNATIVGHMTSTAELIKLDELVVELEE